MIETHVHFNHDALASDLSGVLERATDVGVTDFLVVGFDLPSSERAVTLAATDPRLYAAVGLHPHHAAEWNEEVEATLRAWAALPHVAALGEIGLDYHRDLAPRDLQRDAFLAQLALARALDLPVILHCRDAYPEALDILEEHAIGMTVVLHCFAGTRDEAERAWHQGWYLGIGGPVTYRKNDALRQIVRIAPAERLLLETDAPYLSPEPLRGKFPNEPARLAPIRDQVAQLRGASPEEIDVLTTANARRALPKMKRPGGNSPGA